MTAHHLTAIILTYNEARHISECIAALAFADRVLVFDSGSSDGTTDLARQAGADVLTRPFDNYAGQRNAALQAVAGTTKWVLFIDADERVTPDLRDEIALALADTVYAGFRIPRDNEIFGRITRGAGWFPDYQTRLLRSGAAHYDPAHPVHELVVLAGELGTLNSPLFHENYISVGQFIAKQRRYAALDARIAFDRGERPRPHHIVTMPLRQFWWRFVTLRGYSDGLHGLRLSALMGWFAFLRHRLLVRLWVEQGAPPTV